MAITRPAANSCDDFDLSQIAFQGVRILGEVGSRRAFEALLRYVSRTADAFADDLWPQTPFRMAALTQSLCRLGQRSAAAAVKYYRRVPPFFAAWWRAENWTGPPPVHSEATAALGFAPAESAA